MLAPLGRWLRATFDYNPTFPISALLLLAGVEQLGREGLLDAASPAGAASGASIVQAYELALLGIALLVLWPRRIAYETTAILIIFGVVRFAPPSLAIGLAVEGRPFEAALLGAGLALLMAFQNELVSRRVLPLARRERLYDAALYAVASVGLPLLASELAHRTGSDFSHDAARRIQLAAWWGAALLLAPLARKLPDLGPETPLHVPGPTAVLRSWLARRTGLCALGLPALLGNALWLGGAGPVPLFLLPLGLVLVAIALAVARRAGLEEKPVFAHFPAVACAFVLLAPHDTLVGQATFISRPAALALLLPVAAAFVPLLAPSRVRSGLRSLAVVTGVAPLVLAPSFEAGERYLLVVSLLLVLVGLARRDERVLVHGALAAIALALHLGWDGDVAAASRLALGSGAVLALLVALRLPRGGLAPGLALGLAAAPAVFETARGVPEAGTVALALAASLALALLGRRRGEAVWVRGALVLAVAIFARRFATRADPGLLLVALAFGLLVAGTFVALRRERRASAREAASSP